jgi:hypothetical protein
MRRLTESRIAILSVLLLVGACSSTQEPSSEAVRPSASPSRSVANEAPPETEDPQPYQATVRRVGPKLAERMRFSHREGCPVELEDLRYLRMSYVGFDGAVRTGEMVVHEDYATQVVKVFGRLYDAAWPIRGMQLVDTYRGDDDRSMAANNSSGFNCRRVAGSTSWSEHAYGAAIDINPVQNPYVQGAAAAPPAGRRFASIDRSAGAPVPPGAIRSGDLVVRAFAEIGWQWGGDWSSAKDYQHFSADGG